MSDNKIIATTFIGCGTLLVIGIVVVLKMTAEQPDTPETMAVPSSSVLSASTTSRVPEAGGPTTMPKTSAQLELDALRAENQRLRQELQRESEAAQQALQQLRAQIQEHQRATQTQPLTAVISGSAWLTRSNASSDLLRGLRVRLLRPNIPGANVQRCVEVDVEEWKQVMSDFAPPKNDDRHGQRELFEKELAKRVNRAKEKGVAGETIETKEALALVANLYADKRAAMRNIINVGETAALEFRLKDDPLAAQLQTITNHARLGLLSLVTRSNTISMDGMVIAASVTDADGTFRFENVPAGDYCLNAETSSSEVFMEWAIPIQVQGGTPVKINLYNDNALLAIGR